jgi:CheY-like chemotaxis protein
MARVLVVEDDPDILALVERRVKSAGHTVRTAETATEALAIVEDRGPPDVAVLDVVLPGMTGLELAQRFRDDERTRDLPIVFLSARVEQEDLEAGWGLGAIYLTKPFVASALLAAIDKSLPESPW